MKRSLAMIGWLMMASASFGADGQHTGVGGNPFVPPPNPSSFLLPAWTAQMIVTPGLLFMAPEWSLPEAAEPADEAKTGTHEEAGASSAQ